MGSHEGLGLGFYEALYCGTPVLTMNWIPNNEIIQDTINGWLLKCDFAGIHYDNETMIHQGKINEGDLTNKIVEILDDENTLNIINNTIQNSNHFRETNCELFEKNINEIFS